MLFEAWKRWWLNGHEISILVRGINCKDFTERADFWLLQLSLMSSKW
jgi:hypothetical protein